MLKRDSLWSVKARATRGDRCRGYSCFAHVEQRLWLDNDNNSTDTLTLANASRIPTL
ncbi:MAG TPA: hypothetical protein V6C50_11975 [Crinalium sp.]